MTNLMETNPEAARGIKIRLVTVEIMPYLKDGHLLDIILGMERDDLVTFLSGTREHIRGLILAKAPEELAESWVEELGNVRSIAEANFRLVEMKVLGRIRSLANNGVINLLDINDMIFGKAGRGGAPMTIEPDLETIEQRQHPAGLPWCPPPTCTDPHRRPPRLGHAHPAFQGPRLGRQQAERHLHLRPLHQRRAHPRLRPRPPRQAQAQSQRRHRRRAHPRPLCPPRRPRLGLQIRARHRQPQPPRHARRGRQLRRA